MAYRSVLDDENIHSTYDKVLIDIVSYVFHFTITSPRTWQRARAALLDALGCGFETLRESPEAVALIGPIVPNTVVPDGFRLPGTSHQLDPMKGAFDLGCLIRYLDHNDAFPDAEWGHPSDNIGAILAVADWQSRVSLSIGQKPLTMEAVLLALVKAYEIQGCFQVHSELNKAGFDHTILVKVASTAAVSWLLDLSENQTLDALSLAWMDGTPLRVYRQPPNVGSRKGWAAGDACMRAVHLALLTKNGQPGAPTVLTASRWGFYDTLFEGQHFRLPRPLGSWVIESIFFKIHAAEGHAASGVEAALELCEQLRVHNLSPERDIMHIQVRTQHAAKIAMDKQGRLHNSADRDHCMQYMIAVILLKGYTICAADYQNDSPWARDPRVEDLRKRIDLVEDQQFTAENHDSLKQSASNALKVTLRDGVDLNEVVVEYPAGHPWREDAVKMVKTKFEKNVVKWFDKDEQDVVLKLASSNVEEFKKLTVCEFVDTFFKQ